MKMLKCNQVCFTQKNNRNVLSTIYTLCIMPRSRTGPGNESHKNKTGLVLMRLVCIMHSVYVMAAIFTKASDL